MRKVSRRISVCHHCGLRQWDHPNNRLLCSVNGEDIVRNAETDCPRGLFGDLDLSERSSISDIKRALASANKSLLDGWQHWENVQAAYRAELADFAATLKPWQPDTWTWKGRGIVICGGGKYAASAYATIRAIRHLGCTLPAELWLLPTEQLARWQTAALDGLGVTVRKPEAGTTVDNGWGLKFYAIQQSNFAEVLYFDADCYPLTNPAAALYWPEYIESGCVLWCDPPMQYPKPGARITPEACEAMGVPYSDEPAKDSGILLIDKTRHLRGLRLADWMNREHHRFYYRDIHGNGGYSYGDKDLLWLAMRYLGDSYVYVEKPWQGIRPGGLHFTPAGEPFAFHRFNGKFTLAPTSAGLFPLTTQNPLRNDALPLESEMHAFLEDLRAIRTAHRPRIHGVFVCVNYADYLEQTVESLLPHADAWTCVTVAGDPAIELCAKHGINTLLSDRVHHAGSKFNLGALRNDAYKHVAATDPDAWIMSIDPDCQFPPDFRSIFDDIDLDPANIYGAKREGGETTDHQCSGFFQMFHASQVRAGRLYREDHIDAGWTDVWFKDLWPAENRISVAAAVLKHLGRPYLDHVGRVSSKADGRMAKREKTGPERWDELHRRPAESPDLWREPRWLEWFAKDLPTVGCACKSKWAELIKQHPPRIYDRESYARWSWERHNDINRELGKPAFPWEAAAKKYGWPAALYPAGQSTAPRAVKIFGLQRCGTNLAMVLLSRNFEVIALGEKTTGWKHGMFIDGDWADDARFAICVRHPLTHLVRFYAYATERMGLDPTLPSRFKAGMSFADFLATPCYEFASPAHRWSSMYAHWLEALPAGRTVIVRQEDQLEDQSWVIGMIGRRLGLVSLGEPLTESCRVDVNGFVRDEPAVTADLSPFTPDLRALVTPHLAPALMARLGYSI